MKVLKKVLPYCLSLFIVACTNLDFNLDNNTSTGLIREIKGLEDSSDNNTNISTNKSKDSEKKVVAENKIVEREVTNENISDYLSEIKSNLKNDIKINDDEIKSSYVVGIGETLVFPLQNENTMKLTSTPKNTVSKVNIVGDKIHFRSIYKGNYTLTTYLNGAVSRRIVIVVQAKYNFSEKEFYDIIAVNSKNFDKNLDNTITLYKMMYPNGRYSKNINYLFLKYGYENKNNQIVNEALKSIKDNFTSYTDEEKIYILGIAKEFEKDIFIPSTLFETDNAKLKSALDDYIGNSKEPTLDELKDQAIEATKELKDKIKDGIGNLFSGSSSAKEETYYDKAMKNLNSNPRLAIENFKKSLSTEKVQDKKQEIYYNIANLYAKQGNKAEVTKYLKLLKQEFPNSEWIKKVEILTK